MIFSLKKVSGGIDKIYDVPLVFLENAIWEYEFSEKLFPVWFRKVLNRCPGVRDKFKSLFEKFKILNKRKQRYFIDLYRNSKNIDFICSDVSNIYPTIDKIDVILKKEIIELFKFLFEGTVGTEIFRQQSKMHINDHYEKFQELNNVFVCPFCGLETYTLPKFRRAEYDHFLPISLYPWLGVNFDNLVPMGDHCNGKKNQKNTLFSDKDANIRRSVWYPYKWISHGIKLNCLQKPTLLKIEGECEFIINASDSSNQNKIDTWNEIFEISDRFSEMLSTFHVRFIEDFAHKNDIKRKKLVPLEIKKELSKYQSKGIGHLSIEPLAKLKFLWSDYYIRKATDAEINVIANKIEHLRDRVKP